MTRPTSVARGVPNVTLRYTTLAVYDALNRLIRTTDAPEPDADKRREYWVATRLGREALEAELTRLEAVVSAGRARIALGAPLGSTAGKPTGCDRR